jgi:ribose transport system permease protein
VDRLTSTPEPEVAEAQSGVQPLQGPEVLDRRRSPVLEFVNRYKVLIFLALALVVLSVFFVPEFLSSRNLLNVLQQMAIIGVITLGMHFVIVTAGIDLSVGSILQVTTVTFALMLSHSVPLGLALVLGLGVGAVFGIVNGLGVTVLKVQPFVITLGTLAIGQGVALTLSDGQQVLFQNDSSVLNFLGRDGVGQLSGQFIVFIILAVTAWAVLRWVPFGRYVYAVGGNPETARLSGIRVNRVLMAVYVISGVCAALAGIMTTATLSVGVPTAGALSNLDAIAAVVIGGTSLMGGRGSVWGSVAGAFILATIANLIVLMGAGPYQAYIVRGTVIIAAVALASVELSRPRRNRKRPSSTAAA